MPPTFYRRWILANAWSEGIGLGTTLLLGLAAAGYLAGGPAPGPGAVVAAALAAVIAGTALDGALVGFAQGRVIHAAQPRIPVGRWTLATAAGAGIAWLLGMIPSTVLALLASDPVTDAPAEPPAWLTYVLAAAMGLVLGVVLALPQTLVLRRVSDRAATWLPANALAWAVGMPLVFLGMDVLPWDGPRPVVAAGVAGVCLATGAVVGAVHGVVLRRILGPAGSVPPEGAPSPPPGHDLDADPPGAGNRASSSGPRASLQPRRGRTFLLLAVRRGPLPAPRAGASRRAGDRAVVVGPPAPVTVPSGADRAFSRNRRSLTGWIPMRLLAALPFLALAACGADPTGPDPLLNRLPNGLDVRLTVAPPEVSPHAPFTVTLEVTNPTSDTLRVVTAHGCLAVTEVLRGSERVPLQGSGWACYAAITTHTFAPGETRTRTWPMRAELYARDAGDPDGAPAPRGTYTVQARFDTLTGDGMPEPLRVEAPLRVR
jgi:hypothetical protein